MLNFIKFVIIIRIWSISTTTKEINKEIEKFYSGSAAGSDGVLFNNPPIAPTIVYATITIMMAMTPVAIPSASSSSDSN